MNYSVDTCKREEKRCNISAEQIPFPVVVNLSSSFVMNKPRIYLLGTVVTVLVFY